MGERARPSILIAAGPARRGASDAAPPQGGRPLARGIATAALAWALAAGCGAGTEPAEPKLGTIRVRGPAPAGPPPALSYRFGFVRPKADDPPFRPGDPIEVEFILDRTKEERRPMKLLLYLLAGDVNADSGFADLVDEPEPGKMRFRGTLRAPDRPGDYSIRAEAIQSTLYDDPGRGSEALSRALSERRVVRVRTNPKSHG